MLFYRFLLSEEPDWFDIENSFILSDDKGDWLYVPLQSEEQAQKYQILHHYEKYEKIELNIDWENQWQTHAPHFHDGVAEIDLAKYGSSSLYLNPGPGFGDLSHPTTRLVLDMMASHVKDKVVIDIGCGSGILALAALRLGARSAIGLDIDAEAVAHAQENAGHNQLQNMALFTLDSQAITHVEKLIILMNMISSEQMMAWASVPMLHDIDAMIFTSGILHSERTAYLEVCKQRGWKLECESREDDWLGFYFLQCK